jgi:hypothetical protein
MSFLDNPFLRGYWGLNVQRVLEIVLDKSRRPIRRLLHPSQEHLSDDQIALKSCLLRNGYALVTEGQRISRDLRAQSNNTRGFVADVRYAIQADDDGQSVHLGDVSSQDEAREIVRRLSFETGLFNRCWEISYWHLDRPALSYLERLADAHPPLGPLFFAFRVNEAFGVKLIDTPWNDSHLQYNGLCRAALRRIQLERGVPESLIHVLHLAGEADVRFLIFDGGAPRLDALPTYVLSCNRLFPSMRETGGLSAKAEWGRREL